MPELTLQALYLDSANIDKWVAQELVSQKVSSVVSITYLTHFVKMLKYNWRR